MCNLSFCNISLMIVITNTIIVQYLPQYHCMCMILCANFTMYLCRTTRTHSEMMKTNVKAVNFTKCNHGIIHRQAAARLGMSIKRLGARRRPNEVDGYVCSVVYDEKI